MSVVLSITTDHRALVHKVDQQVKLHRDLEAQ
jgi:hypothetical protein